MWSQEGREAFTLFMALVESKLIEVSEQVEEFISAYRSYIIVGLLILMSLVIMDRMRTRQNKRTKQQINAEIAKQMQKQMRDKNKEE